MLPGFRALLLAVCCGVVLTGCGGSGSGGDDAPVAENPPPPVAPNSAVATPSTTHVDAKVNGGSQALSITFTSDDGQPITNLAVDGLTALPSGWSGASAFSCATVATGNGCVLNLTYAPTVASNDQLLLHYTYTTKAGTPGVGSIGVTYSGTTDNNVTATPDNPGQVVAVVGQAVTVTINFDTDDHNTATELQLTTDLGALPADWVLLQNTLPCNIVGTGQQCDLQLQYSPGAVGSGTLLLEYAFVDNSGTAKTGSLNIPYAATVSNNVVHNIASTRIDARIGGSKQTTISFTTDDGNPASDFSIAQTLPAGWSADTYDCASVATANTCDVTLTYAPSSPDSGSFSVDYSYLDNSGQSKQGALNISYLGRNVYAYIADATHGVRYCEIDSGGLLNNCQSAGVPLAGVDGISFHDGDAFVSKMSAGNVLRCSVGVSGALSNCVAYLSGLTSPGPMAVSESHLYVVNYGSVTTTTSACSFASGTCAQTASVTGGRGIALSGQHAFIGTGMNGSVSTCQISPTGDLENCFSNAAFGTLIGVEVANGLIYVADQGNASIRVCNIDPGTGGLSGCVNAASVTNALSVEVAGDYMYVGLVNGLVRCEVQNNGLPQNCMNSTGGTTFSVPRQIVVD